MNKEDVFKFAGSIGGKAGSGGGSIGGKAGNYRDNRNNNSECIIVESLKSKESIVYIEKLRNWRDEVLIQYMIGRILIKAYYYVSPKLVKLSKRVPVIKRPVEKTAIAIANLL